MKNLFVLICALLIANSVHANPYFDLNEFFRTKLNSKLINKKVDCWKNKKEYYWNNEFQEYYANEELNELPDFKNKCEMKVFEYSAIVNNIEPVINEEIKIDTIINEDNLISYGTSKVSGKCHMEIVKTNMNLKLEGIAYYEMPFNWTLTQERNKIILKISDIRDTYISSSTFWFNRFFADDCTEKIRAEILKLNGRKIGTVSK